MEMSLFNVKHGFAEAVLRGFRSGFLGPEDYRRIATSDTLEDMRSALEETDFGTFLQDEPSPLLVSTISKKCYEKLSDDFKFLRAQASAPLSTFLDFIAQEKMIDNVCMIIQCALNNKAPHEMMDKLHPLGMFPGITMIMSETFDVQGGFEDVYRIFLAETPIGPYIEKYIRESDESMEGGFETSQMGGVFNKQDLEIMRATLKKAWLEEFKGFVNGVGGTTAEVMGHILDTEADFRVLMVTLNALNTQLSTESRLQDRNSLYPDFGYLHPEGTMELRKAWNDSTVRTALEVYPRYLALFDQVKQFYDSESHASGAGRTVTGQGFQSIEDLIYAENVHMYELAFEQQYHFGIFYAWVKLREQEIRNLRWIANMIVLNTKDHIDDTIVPIFTPKV